MANSASRATQPSESDFHDSHPQDDDMSSPSLGDLTGIDSLPEGSDDDAKSVGDINSVNASDDDDNDVLGDITLLEEAFAEMEDDADQPSDDNDAPANNAVGDNEEASIPVLNEAVDEPTGDPEPNSTPVDPDQSIPVLDRQATVFAEAASESASADMTNNDLEDNTADNIDDDDALEALLDDVSAVSQAIAEDASVFAEPDDGSDSRVSQFEEAMTNFAEISSSAKANSAIDELSVSAIEDVPDNNADKETVDDKIAQMTSEQQGNTEVNEVPLSHGVTSFEADNESASDPYAGLDSQFAESDDSVPLSSVVSTFAEEDKAPLSKPTHAEHKVSVGQGSEIAFNVPFELHTQLSKKIDELVIDATTSLTNELQNHLSDRLEILLAQSVETVLPSLVDQMVNGLRGEVKQRVKEQLPVIINEVLGKTSLRDK